MFRRLLTSYSPSGDCYVRSRSGRDNRMTSQTNTVLKRKRGRESWTKYATNTD